MAEKGQAARAELAAWPENLCAICALTQGKLTPA